MAAKFELKKNKAGKYMFNLLATNGQVILTSEAYADKSNALNGIESVRKNAVKDANFERKVTQSGMPYFVLKATNGQVIGTSEQYSSNAAMENGVKSVMENAPKAVVVEEEE